MDDIDIVWAIAAPQHLPYSLTAREWDGSPATGGTLTLALVRHGRPFESTGSERWIPPTHPPSEVI